MIIESDFFYFYYGLEGSLFHEANIRRSEMKLLLVGKYFEFFQLLYFFQLTLMYFYWILRLFSLMYLYQKIIFCFFLNFMEVLMIYPSNDILFCLLKNQSEDSSLKISNYWKVFISFWLEELIGIFSSIFSVVFYLLRQLLSYNYWDLVVNFLHLLLQFFLTFLFLIESSSFPFHSISLFNFQAFCIYQT